VKVTHWVNSCVHLAQARGGHFRDARVATVSTCQKLLRQRLAQDLSLAGSFVLFIGAVKPDVEYRDEVAGHSCSEWRAGAAGRVLAVLLVNCLLPAKEAAALFPDRSDTGPIRRRSGKSSSPPLRARDRFAASSEDATRMQQVLVSTAFRVWPLGAAPVLQGSLWEAFRSSRAPLSLSPGDDLWQLAATNLGDAWRHAAVG